MGGLTRPNSETNFNPYRVSNRNSYDSGLYRIVSNTIHEHKRYGMRFVSPSTCIVSYRTIRNTMI